MSSLRRIGACALLVGLVIGGSIWAGLFAQATPTSQLAEKGSGPAVIDPQSDALLKRMAASLTSSNPQYQ